MLYQRTTPVKPQPPYPPINPFKTTSSRHHTTSPPHSLASRPTPTQQLRRVHCLVADPHLLLWPRTLLQEEDTTFFYQAAVTAQT